MLNNNLIATILTFVAALAWLRINDFAAHRGWISSRLSRKIIHMGTGPIYVLCWLLFKDTDASRFLAALVPLVITVQFILVGFGVIKDDAAVQAMSRSGDPREILRGPTFYGIIFVVATIFYWLDNPIGMVALMLMCGGDGLADIVGRRWGTEPRWTFRISAGKPTARDSRVTTGRPTPTALTRVSPSPASSVSWSFPNRRRPTPGRSGPGADGPSRRSSESEHVGPASAW